MLRQQVQDLKDFHADESLALDPGLDYDTIEGLSNEVRERLNLVKPESFVRVSLFFIAFHTAYILLLSYPL